MRKLLSTIGMAAWMMVAAVAQSQTSEAKLKWFNPAESEIPCLQQRGFVEEMRHSYARLPDRAKDVIPEAVWNLSRHAAGVGIYFYTNASEIHVRYAVGGGFNMAHMPSTGVSGIDLYWIDRQGDWYDIGPKYSFGDTVKFNYFNLDTTLQQEYRMFLPLYNSVTWMEIGVPENALFEVAPIRREKPIVVYGTSIAQGGCASRPGNAWTNALSRYLDWPVINLGFSGNGKLDKSVIDFINEIDAAVYMLDCYPNLGAFTEEEKYQRTVDAVRQIRAKHPEPIVIVEHTGFNKDWLQEESRIAKETSNRAAWKAYETLKDEVKDLYLLPFDKTASTEEVTVEGVHPNDYGMVVIARKHEAFLRNLLKMPVGDKATMIPITQRREPGTYGWQERHQDILRQNAENAPKNVIMGNSITHYWGGAHRRQNGRTTWESKMKPAGYRNMGCGWDYVQNVLWRVYHSELDGFEAENIILNIGTNNLGFDSDEDIVDGVVFLLKAIRERQPKAHIKYVAIYPRKNNERRVATLNEKLKKAILPLDVEFCDLGHKFLQEDGTIDPALFTDGLHPNEEGYKRIAEGILK